MTDRLRERGSHRDREDLRLIELIRERDLGAFEQLYRDYHPRLTRFLTNLVRQPQLVEEVLNDTMFVVWRRPEGFNGASKLSTWIFAIAYRTALKGLRRLDEPVEDTAADVQVSLDADPEQRAGSTRIQEILMSAMSQLSPAHRAVVDLTYFHGMAYREIAEVMMCPVDTVKTRMFHAKRHLKRSLAGQLADWL